MNSSGVSVGGSRCVSAGRIQSSCHPVHLHSRVLLPAADSTSGGKPLKLDLCCVCESGGLLPQFGRKVEG